MKTIILQIATFIILISCCTKKEDEVHKNVLLIVVDDLRTELGSYGNQQVISPNIDKIANNGMLFTNAYVQQSVCSASRASFLTGCYPKTVGVDYPYSEYFLNEFITKYPSLPVHFYRNGYYTRTFGKIHHGYEDKELSEPHWYPDAKMYALEENNLKKQSKKNHWDKKSPAFESADLPDHSYADGMVAEKVVETLKNIKSKDRPFFIAAGFIKPHLPFCAPKKYWDMYQADELDLAMNKFQNKNVKDYVTTHYALKPYSGPDNNSHPEKLPDDYAKKLIHGYYACISFIDNQVGKILNELEKQDLDKNTVVVFMSDHGFHLGEHGMWGKCTNYEVATKSPLIVHVPGMKNKNKTTSAIVEFVDIYPTISELAGIEIPGYVQGVSFNKVLQNPDLDWKKSAFSIFPRRGHGFTGYAIRTKNYRYVEWQNDSDGSVKSAELYHSKSDPAETVNLANLSEYSEVVESMSILLNSGWKNSLPDGITNSSNLSDAPFPPVPGGDEGKGIRKEILITDSLAKLGYQYSEIQKQLHK